jgi:hypothetical protein
MVSYVADVKIRQFWTEKWIKVPFLSFRIAQVPRMKKMKTERTKNKVSKLQEVKWYLTLSLNYYIF